MSACKTVKHNHGGAALKPTLALAIAGVLAACGGGSGGGGGSPPPPPPPAAQAPSVDLTINKTSARVGQDATLTWTSQNATNCTASGGWSGAQPTSGTATIEATQVGSSSFQISCTGAGGSASDSVSLNTLAALNQVKVPGVPAPVTVAGSDCEPTDDDIMTISCITRATDVRAVYDRFSSTLSGRVVMTSSTDLRHHDRRLLQRRLRSPAGATLARDDVRRTYDSNHRRTVTEVVYKPEFLRSLGVQDVITTMSVIIFQDDSNLARTGVIVHMTGPSGPLTYVVAGTIKEDGGLDLAQCIAESSDTPPPPPPPTGLTCTAGRGSGANGLSWAPQTLSYELTGGQGRVTWGVRYNDPNRTADSYTGSLRVALWAVPMKFTGSGDINGYRLLTASPNFVGQGARSSNQIYNFYTFSDIASTRTYTRPPRVSIASSRRSTSSTRRIADLRTSSATPTGRSSARRLL